MLNNVVLMGRITHELELKGTQNGKNYVRFSIAVNRKYQKDKEKQVADFIECLAWEKTAEFICNYFDKPDMIAVCGSLQTNNYEDKDGNKRKSVFVLVREVSFCGGQKKETGKNSKNTVKSAETEELDDDFLPF